MSGCQRGEGRKGVVVVVVSVVMMGVSVDSRAEFTVSAYLKADDDSVGLWRGGRSSRFLVGSWRWLRPQHAPNGNGSAGRKRHWGTNSLLPVISILPFKVPSPAQLCINHITCTILASSRHNSAGVPRLG